MSFVFDNITFYEDIKAEQEKAQNLAAESKLRTVFEDPIFYEDVKSDHEEIQESFPEYAMRTDWPGYERNQEEEQVTVIPTHSHAAFGGRSRTGTERIGIVNEASSAYPTQGKRANKDGEEPYTLLTMEEVLIRRKLDLAPKNWNKDLSLKTREARRHWTQTAQVNVNKERAGSPTSSPATTISQKPDNRSCLSCEFKKQFQNW